MNIIKSKRKATCWRCRQPITMRYRVKEGNHNYHLRCYHRTILSNFDYWKDLLKMFKKTKYKKQMVLEGLR